MGWGGVILKTINGGANWIAQSSGTTNSLRSVMAPNSSTVYVVGGNGTILKTINGGTIWTTQTSGISNWLNSVCFTNTNTGYACSDAGSILKTTNGGVFVAENDLLDGHLNVFPNPASDYLIIETTEKTFIEILNIEGQLLKRLEANGNKINVDISMFSSGVYIIKATTDKGITTKRFLKE